MKILPVIYNHQRQNKNPDINFKGYHVINVGAGSARGTLCLAHNAKEEAVLALNRGKDFMSVMVNYIEKTVKGDKNPKILFGTTGAIGSEGKREKVSIPNIVGKDGKMVGTVYFDEFEQAIRKKFPKAKIKITNDGFQQGLSDLLSKDVRNFLSKIKTGKSVFVKFGGGGCGSYHILKLKNGYQISTNEGGHTQMSRILTAKEKKVLSACKSMGVPSIEDAAISVKSTNRNFAKALGYTDKEALTLAYTAEGRIPTDRIIKLNRDNLEQKSQANVLRRLSSDYKKLQGRPFFIHTKEGNFDKFVLIDPKTNQAVSGEATLAARKVALGLYFKQIAMMLKDAVVETAHPKLLVTSNIDRFFKQSAEESGLDVGQIVRESAYKNLDNALQAAVKPEELGIEIVKTGDPGREDVARLIFAKGSKMTGSKIGFIPNSALAKKST